MALRSEDSPILPLSREVLAPQKQPSGAGVLLVASAAMFFAVASSAMILRSQMPLQNGSCTHRRAVPMRVIPVDVNLEVEARDCQNPTFSAGADGKIRAQFNLCDKTGKFHHNRQPSLSR